MQFGLSARRSTACGRSTQSDLIFLLVAVTKRQTIGTVQVLPPVVGGLAEHLRIVSLELLEEFFR